MNTKRTALILIALTGSALIATAGSPEGKKGEGRGGKTNEHMLKQFDKDGDGKLSESEREAAKAAMKERASRADTDGDGNVSDQEREAARAQMMKRLDTDGDGKISDAERQAAQEQGGKRPDKN